MGTPAATQTMLPHSTQRHESFYLRIDRNKNKNESQLMAVLGRSPHGCAGTSGIRAPRLGALRQQEQKSLSRSAYSPDRAPDSHTSVQPGSGHPFSADLVQLPAPMRRPVQGNPAHRHVPTLGWAAEALPPSRSIVRRNHPLRGAAGWSHGGDVRPPPESGTVAQKAQFLPSFPRIPTVTIKSSNRNKRHLEPNSQQVS
jgi:hypothetical protein